VELLRTRHKKAKVARAVYYFPTHKGGRERVPIPAPTRAQVAAVLADLREVILGGAFIHATEKDSCRWCDFTAACGEHAHGRAEGKLADGKLKAYVRLAEHE
jgi:CRISPR/Cas system-associated exonuclease Cas4 (RecB family)